MGKTILKTDLHCESCISNIEPIFKNNEAIKQYSFDLDHVDNLIEFESNAMDIESIISQIKENGYSAEVVPTRPDTNYQNKETTILDFWNNVENWKRASFNTLNCLIGCSIGDFGMIIFLQAYYPSTPLIWQMTLAIIAGLMTSVALETIILKSREKFNLGLAFKTALSMSFISMIGMEFAMNLTDFMITGGQAAFNTLSYWLALAPSMIVGFLLPLPYNYYKLEKHGMACH